MEMYHPMLMIKSTGYGKSHHVRISMQAVICTVGDELLNGQTIDTNASWIGQRLNEIGISVAAMISVGDRHDELVSALDFAFAKAAIVIMTGGLGPTHDDVTKSALATYFDDILAFDQSTFEHIDMFFRRLGRSMTDAHRVQCLMPTKAQLVANAVGTAPGMWIHSDGQYVLSMPGVPSEMKYIMQHGGLELLRKTAPKKAIHHEFIHTAGVGETRIAEQIADIVKAFPPQVSLAYLPSIAAVKLRITAQGASQDEVTDLGTAWADRIYHRIGGPAYGRGDDTLPVVIGRLALERGLMIGTAESCTGGSIAKAITSISGSSAYFSGSMVAYANELKTKLLHVEEHVLKIHGAVSEETVRSMVKGAIDTLDVHVAVSVSGIAGPGGGTVDKPVGTIWLAVGNQEDIWTTKLQLAKTRHLNIAYTVTYALDMLRRWLVQH